MQLCCLRRFLEGGCCSHLAPNMGRRWGPKFNDGKKSLAETNMSNIVTTSVSASPRASLPTELAASASPRASSGSSASPRASLPTEFAVAGTGSLWMKREIARCRLSYLLNDSRVHTAGTGSLCSAALSSDDGGAASALSSDDGGADAPAFSSGEPAPPPPPAPPSVSPEEERRQKLAQFHRQMRTLNLLEWSLEAWERKFGTVHAWHPLGISFWPGFHAELVQWLPTSKVWYIAASQWLTAWFGFPASGSAKDVERPYDAQTNSDNGHWYPTWITPMHDCPGYFWMSCVHIVLRRSRPWRTHHTWLSIAL